MNLEDIRRNLLLQSDGNTLVNLCDVDHISRNICSTKLFWEEKYVVDGIPFNKYFKNNRLNIYEYIYVEKCFNLAKQILMKANIDDTITIIILDNPNKLEIFNVEGINYELIRSKMMPVLINFLEYDISLHDIVSVDDLKLTLTYNGEGYNILHKDYIFYKNINRTIALNILYNSIYTGNNVILKYMMGF